MARGVGVAELGAGKRRGHAVGTQRMAVRGSVGHGQEVLGDERQGTLCLAVSSEPTRTARDEGESESVEEFEASNFEGDQC